MSASEALRTARMKLGMPQQELAERLSISAQFLCDCEHGRRVLSEQHVALLPIEIRRPVARAMIRDHQATIARLRMLAEAKSAAFAIGVLLALAALGGVTP